MTDLRLPAEGRVGNWSVERVIQNWGEEYDPLFTFLFERAGKQRHCWMSSTPLEMRWTQRLADATIGDNILIGGLGLGLLPQLLLPSRGRQILVLEKYQEVIALVLKDWQMPVGLGVQLADAWDFLRRAPEPRYSSIIMDLWVAVDGPEQQAEIARLHQLAEPWLAPGGRWIAWGDIDSTV